METPALGCFLLCSFGVRLRRKALGLEVPSGLGFAGLKTSLPQPRGGYRPAALRRAACPRVKSSANKSANASKCIFLHQLECPRPARLQEPLGLQPGLSGAEESAGAVMGTGGTVPAWVLPAARCPPHHTPCMCVSGFCCFFSVSRAHLLRRVLCLLPGACCSQAPLAFRAVEHAAGTRTLLPRVLLSAVPASVTARPAAGFARFVGWWEHSEAGGRKIPELGSSDWPQWARALGKSPGASPGM